jgi:hypothetical protein
MSRGPGKIERAIEAAFLKEPSRTFSTQELIPIAYPGRKAVEKKHRVAVLRAANKIARLLWWRGRRSERPGGEVVFSNLLDVRSYALGHLRRDFSHYSDPPEKLNRLLDDPKVHCSHWHFIQQPDGAWWKHVEIYKAEKEGAADRAEQLKAELESMVARKAKELGINL